MASPETISTTEWLRHLYQHCPKGWLTIWAKNKTDGGHRTLWAMTHDITSLLSDAKPLRSTHDLYFGVATRATRLQGTSRGKREDCTYIPALWLDIDMRDGHGKHDDELLPTTLTDAYQLLATFPVPPTSIVETGGGLQAWWQFDEAIDSETAAPILEAWDAAWQHAANNHGWHIDNVHDLPRVMRLPGTLNHRGEPAIPTVIVTADWTRTYTVEDITQWLTFPTTTSNIDLNKPPVLPAGPGRPGDQWAARITWHQLITPDGWAWHHRSGDEDHWTRPGKTVKDGTSATTNYEGSDVLKVFTSNAAPLQQNETYNKFHYLAVTRFAGDHAAATRWLVEQGYGTPAAERIDPAELIAKLPPATVAPAADDDSWVPYDLAPYVTGDYQPPLPSILNRPDNRGLIYPAAVNVLFGAPGVGKTWGAIAAITQHIQAGNQAAFIDLEDHPGKLVARLKSFGLTNNQIETQFHYLRPNNLDYTTAITTTQHLANQGVDLIVIDSYGEMLGLAGLDEYSNPDVTANTQQLLRPIVRQGHALILIDHVVKSEDGSRGYALGAQRKKAMIDGASWELTSDGYSRQRAGTITIKCAKDRNGWYANREHAADLHLNPQGDCIEWSLTIPADAPGEDAPHGTPNTPTVLMERISQYLADCGPNDPQTARSICKAVTGKDTAKRRALRELVEQGYTTEIDGYNGHTKYAHKHPYSEAGSLIDGSDDDRWTP